MNRVVTCYICSNQATHVDPQHNEPLCSGCNQFNDSILKDQGSKLIGLVKCCFNHCSLVATKQHNNLPLCQEHFDAYKKQISKLIRDRE